MEPGLKFGRWTSIQFSHKDSSNIYFWLFKCDCGNEKVIRAMSVTSGRSKSCGCYDRELKSKRQIKQPGYAACRKVYNTYKHHAERRNLCFELTFEEFKKLGETNCYICGIEPKQLVAIDKSGITTNWSYNGIDREDNTKGYSLNNCRACCKICNVAKNDLTEEEFKNWLNRIVTFNKEM
jgi:hypothetical protein